MDGGLVADYGSVATLAGKQMSRKLLLMFGLGIALVSCVDLVNGVIGRGGRLKSEITGAVNLSASEVDLSRVGGSDWSKLCVIGPYATNETAVDLLEFDWDMESASAVEYGDHVTLLVFASDEAVIDYVDYPRAEGDFAQLGTLCLERADATLVKEDTDDGFVGFRLKNQPLDN